jgi:hypothetical protein
MLIGAFALVALLLAAAGLHGSLAHTVRQRQRELGVRVAGGTRAAHAASCALWATSIDRLREAQHDSGGRLAAASGARLRFGPAQE